MTAPLTSLSIPFTQRIKGLLAQESKFEKIEDAIHERQSHLNTNSLRNSFECCGIDFFKTHIINEKKKFFWSFLVGKQTFLCLEGNIDQQKHSPALKSLSHHSTTVLNLSKRRFCCQNLSCVDAQFHWEEVFLFTLRNGIKGFFCRNGEKAKYDLGWHSISLVALASNKDLCADVMKCTAEMQNLFLFHSHS